MAGNGLDTSQIDEEIRDRHAAMLKLEAEARRHNDRADQKWLDAAVERRRIDDLLEQRKTATR